VIGVGDAFQDAALDQVVQALRQDVAGDPEAGLKIVETGHAEESVPDDEQTPPLPHDIEAVSNRAGHVLEAGPLHSPSL
jgi:hypothetical protein